MIFKVGHCKGEDMKRIWLVLVMLMALPLLTAEGAEIFRHNFYDRYDPTSDTFVYTDDTSDSSATGDQVAVNTYLQKSIQIVGVVVGESIEIRIEGRLKDQVNTSEIRASNFVVLDSVSFGSASVDTAINQIVDVTEYVDFLRIGIRKSGANATSAIDIEGIFTNLER